jgi:Thioredoxin-like
MVTLPLDNKKNKNRILNYMKTVRFTFFLLFIAQLSWSQGIKFLPGTFAEMQALAKKTNKNLFVEVYLNGCPHCKAIEPVLMEKTVGDFYNKNFISWKTEANSEQSTAMQKTKNITYTEFPLFFFFDPQGNLIHQAAPTEKHTRAEFIQEVLKHGKDALNPEQRTSNYDSRWMKGDRDLTFLILYGKYSKATKNIDRLFEITEYCGEIFKLKDDLEHEIGFFIIKSFACDVQNNMGQYFFANLPNYISKFPLKDVGEAVHNVAMASMYAKNFEKTTSTQIEQFRTAYIATGVSEKDADLRVISKLIEADLRENQVNRAIGRVDLFNQKYPMVEYMAYFVRYFNDVAKDDSYIPSLIQWAANAQKVAKLPENAPQLNDISYELARAYLRINKKAEAQQALAESLKHATAAKADTKRHTELQQKIAQ